MFSIIFVRYFMLMPMGTGSCESVPIATSDERVGPDIIFDDG